MLMLAFGSSKWMVLKDFYAETGPDDHHSDEHDHEAHHPPEGLLREELDVLHSVVWRPSPGVLHSFSSSKNGLQKT